MRRLLKKRRVRRRMRHCRSQRNRMGERKCLRVMVTSLKQMARDSQMMMARERMEKRRRNQMMMMTRGLIKMKLMRKQMTRKMMTVKKRTSQKLSLSLFRKSLIPRH